MDGLVDFSQPSFWISAATIVFNPTFWNIAAYQEYHNKVITKIFGKPLYGCYALAATIFSLGIVRDYFYNEALADQPTHPAMLQNPLIHLSAIPLFLTGNLLVLTSMWALGITGTYLGDYFGILMDAPVTSFPFNVSDAPMYHGSTLSFLATAIWKGKPAGIALTAVVTVMYSIARRFEDPFTTMIYEKREQERREGKKGM